MKWIFGLLLTLLLAGAAGCYLLFRYCCVRNRREETREGREKYPKWLADYADQFAAGEVFLETTPYEKVSIQSFDGLTLRGRFYPAADAKGTLLLMHGYRANAVDNFSCIAEFYHRLGYHLLLASQRSHGDSDGKYICFGVKERFDCRDWAVYLSQRPDCAGKSIFLDGISMGATTVLMAAGLELSETVDGIIADSGFTSPWDIVADIAKRRYRLPAHPLLDGLDLMTRCFAGFRLKEYSTLEAMRQNRLPTLFVHGERDGFVPCHMTVQSHAACASEKQLVIVPGAGHGGSYLVDQENCETILRAFLERHTR